MPLILFGLFVLIPILEIATFIQVGGLVGLPLTLFGILFTAVLGAFLVRQQGFKAINDARENMAQQKSPAEQMIHGVFILIAGILLLTPGFLTDMIGFLFLVPPLRLTVAHKVWAWLKQNGSFTVNTGDGSGFSQTREQPDFRYNGDPSRKPDSHSGDVIDGEATEIINDRNIENK